MTAPGYLEVPAVLMPPEKSCLARALELLGSDLDPLVRTLLEQRPAPVRDSVAFWILLSHSLDLPVVAMRRYAQAALDAKRDVAAHHARRTLETYGKGWAAFVAWCKGQGAEPLPASAALVADYASQLAASGRRATGVDVMLAAIAHAHHAAGLVSPTIDPAVRVVRAGIREAQGDARGPSRRRRRPASEDDAEPGGNAAKGIGL